MRVIVDISADGAAFDDENGPVEVAQILRFAAGKMEWNVGLDMLIDSPIILKDANGNTVGSLTVED